MRQARVRQRLPRLPPLPRSCATTMTMMTTTRTTTLDVGLLGKLKKQWLDKCFVNVVGDARVATSSDKTKPARYWIRMRPFWKELSEMMLFWLAVPISTARVSSAASVT